jgi:hypothetical protein
MSATWVVGISVVGAAVPAVLLGLLGLGVWDSWRQGRDVVPWQTMVFDPPPPDERPPPVKADEDLSTTLLGLTPVPADVEGWRVGTRQAVHRPAAEPEPALIFDTLAVEWPAWYAARERALREPTAEFHTLMGMAWSLPERLALLVQAETLGALAEPCSHCADDRDHRPCGGCACPCSLVAVRR